MQVPHTAIVVGEHDGTAGKRPGESNQGRVWDSRNAEDAISSALNMRARWQCNERPLFYIHIRSLLKEMEEVQ